MSSKVKYSIIIPVKDEPEFDKALRKKLRAIETYLPACEFIVVNDGGMPPKVSRNTKRLLQQLYDFKIINLPTNQGKGRAVKVGASKARGEFLIFIDGDDDINPIVMNEIIKKLEDCDVVYGNKNHPSSKISKTPIRNIGSLIVRAIIKLLFPALRMSDTQTGVKGYKREAWDKVIRRLPLDLSSFAYEVELAYVASILGLTICDVPVEVKIDHDSGIIIQIKRLIGLVKDLIKLRLAFSHE